jgi:hypothetical protein
MAIDTSDNRTANLPNVPPPSSNVSPFPITAPAPVTTEAKGNYIAEVQQHPIPEEVPVLLQKILCWPRKHGTESESRFNSWVLAQIISLNPRAKPFTTTSERNICVFLGNGTKHPPTTLFASHMDTVDTPAPVGLVKKINYDPNFGDIYLDKENKVGSCLGADDGVGVWIMLEMIKANIPGGYIFTRGEECGGLGAKEMAKSNPAWLKQFEVCVQFDRPRSDEIITHQRGSTRCASDKFGQALAKALNAANSGFNYSTSARGVYTDNYDWRGVIAECVNVGVGYSQQHCSLERLDLAHAAALLEAVKGLRWDALPVDREPKIEVYSPPPSAKWSGSSPYGYGYFGLDDDADDDFVKCNTAPSQHKNIGKPSPGVYRQATTQPTMHPEDEVLNETMEGWAEFVLDDTQEAVNQVFKLAVELRAMRTRAEALESILFGG